MSNTSSSLARLRGHLDAVRVQAAARWGRRTKPAPASASRSAHKPPFRRKVLFETLEQRILLSGDPVGAGFAGGVLNANFDSDSDRVLIETTGLSAGGGCDVRITHSADGGHGDESYTYGGVTGIIADGGDGDDIFTIASNTADFALDIAITGGDGDDDIIVQNGLILAGQDFMASAEDISVLSGGSITGASTVDLLADGSEHATVSVSGDIGASGAVTLSASAGSTSNISAFGDYTGSSTATVDVQGAGTVVSGASVALMAQNSVQITANAVGSALGATGISQTNVTRAAVSGGASVMSVGTGPTVPDSGGAQVLIQATDDSQISVGLASTNNSSFDFATLFADTVLDRNTTAEVVSSSLASSGLVAVDARNTGGISATTTSGLVGSASNTVTDSASARLQGASATSLGGLTVNALNSGIYAATGKLASNTVDGGTLASISDSTVSTTAAAGVSVTALNDSSLTATSTEVSVDLDLAAVASDLSIGIAYARNALIGDTQAFIDNGSEVLVTGGDLSVDATRGAIISATGEATSVATTGILPGGVTVSLGGLLAENQLLGNVEARIEDAVAETLTSGDILVNAGDFSQVTANTALSATTNDDVTTIGPTGVSGGASVALNSIGWTLPDTALEIVNLALGIGIGETETPQTVSAFVLNAAVDAADDLTVTAVSSTQINATVSDETDSSIGSFIGASSGTASGIFAGNKLSSSTRAFVDYDFDYGSDVVAGDVSQGTRVRLDSGEIYQYLNATPPAGLPVDYAADADWRLINDVRVGGSLTVSADDAAGIAATGSLLSTAGSTSDGGTGIGFNLSDSDAISVGGMIVRNDVRGDVESYIDQAAVNVNDDIDLGATQRGNILANIQSTVTASDGSAWGTGAVFAGGGAIAANLVQGSANAYVTDSDLTTAVGDIRLVAGNTSTIDATVLSAANSGDTAGAVTIALNTIGWGAQDILTQTLDALLGNPFAEDVFGLENPTQVQAYMLDSTADVAGDLSLDAHSEALINATVSNAADSEASAFFGAGGGSMGGVLASNKVSSFAKAFIEFSEGDAAGSIAVDGALAINASDEAGIYSNSKVVSSSMTTNDGGASNLASGILSLVTTTNESGSVLLNFGDQVRLTDTFGVEDFTTADGAQDLLQDQTLVRLGTDYATPSYTTDQGNRTLFSGDVVQVAEGYGGTSGSEGSSYRYVGTATAPLDLGDQDYDNAAAGLWVEVGGNSGSIYEYIGASDTGVDLGLQNYADASLWREFGGTPGLVYEFMGVDDTTLDLARQDYSNFGLWKEVPTDDLLPQGVNYTASNSASIALMVVYNEVRGSVEAYARNALLNVGGTDGQAAISISAIETTLRPPPVAVPSVRARRWRPMAHWPPTWCSAPPMPLLKTARW
jgi:hypothetical protein